MGYCQQRNVLAELLPERGLNDRIRFVICNLHNVEKSTIAVLYGCLPIADVASSRMRSLLWRTIARASARICRCPTDKLLPPLEMALSSVNRPSSVSLCREKRPAARRASFRVASSCWENGSRFCLRVPLRSSGCIRKSGTRQR